jgi:hypothetical protein
MSLKLLKLPDKIAILQHRGLQPSPPSRSYAPVLNYSNTYKLVVLSVRVKMVQLTKEQTVLIVLNYTQLFKVHA